MKIDKRVLKLTTQNIKVKIKQMQLPGVHIHGVPMLWKHFIFRSFIHINNTY